MGDLFTRSRATEAAFGATGVCNVQRAERARVSLVYFSGELIGRCHGSWRRAEKPARKEPAPPRADLAARSSCLSA